MPVACTAVSMRSACRPLLLQAVRALPSACLPPAAALSRPRLRPRPFRRADITSKDVASDPQLCSNPPCCPGRRSPARLVAAWRAICCAPVQLKSSCQWQPVGPADDGAWEDSDTA
jgi:hypothetical protein